MALAIKRLPPMVKRISQLIAALAVIAGIVFGVSAYETKFAAAEDMKQVRQDILLLAQRLENKILEDKIHDLQRRLWALEDRYDGSGVPSAPLTVKEQYRELKYSLECAKRGIK